MEDQFRHEVEGMRLVGHLPGCLPLHGAYARPSPWWYFQDAAQYYLAMPCVLSFPATLCVAAVPAQGMGKLC